MWGSSLVRTPLEMVASELSESLEQYFDDDEARIVQSSLYESDYVFTADGEDYFAVKYMGEGEDESSEDTKLLLFTEEEIERAKSRRDQFKDLLPKKLIMVSHRFDISKDNIRTQDDRAREREIIDSILLEVFTGSDYLRMFLLSLLR